VTPTSEVLNIIHLFYYFLFYFIFVEAGEVVLTDLVDLVIQKHRRRTNMPHEISVEEIVSIKQKNNGSKGVNVNNSNAHGASCHVSLIISYEMHIVFFLE
jgi:uncharacterized alkaline shock family protein YloU